MVHPEEEGRMKPFDVPELLEQAVFGPGAEGATRHDLESSGGRPCGGSPSPGSQVWYRTGAHGARAWRGVAPDEETSMHIVVCAKQIPDPETAVRVQD
jgi:hypothetical protein